MSRIIARASAGLCGLFAVAFAAVIAAQTFPTRPVRMIVPFPPGGSSDTVARVLAERLGESWKHPMVIENRPGAGTTIASALVASAAPDGHTLFLQGISTYASAAGLYRNLAFDPIKGFTPVANVTVSPFLLVVNPAVKATTAKELVDLARAAPSSLTYGSSGNGSTPHLFTEVLARETGAKFVHVPYKGIAPAVTALITGEINFMIADVTVMSHVRSSKARALAVTTPRQSAVAPGVPTLAESGIPGMLLPSYIAVLGPAGIPREIVTALNAELNRVLAIDAVRQRLLGLGFEPAGSTPDELAAMMNAEVQRLTPIIRDANVKLD